MTGQVTALIATVCVALTAWTRCDAIPQDSPAWCGEGPAAGRVEAQAVNQPPGLNFSMSGPAARASSGVVPPAPFASSPVLAVTRPVPPEEFTREAHLTLARACAREADLSPRQRNDHAMIAFVTARAWKWQRQGWSFAETVRRHANLDHDTPRTRWALSLPWGPLVKVRRAAERGQWVSLLRFLWSWSQGWVPDPCPSARTWHGRNPTARARHNRLLSDLVPVECGTSNVALGRAGEM